jgi:hypothetical protein
VAAGGCVEAASPASAAPMPGPLVPSRQPHVRAASSACSPPPLPALPHPHAPVNTPRVRAASSACNADRLLAMSAMRWCTLAPAPPRAAAPASSWGEAARLLPRLLLLLPPGLAMSCWRTGDSVGAQLPAGTVRPKATCRQGETGWCVGGSDSTPKGVRGGGGAGVFTTPTGTDRTLTGDLTSALAAAGRLPAPDRRSHAPGLPGSGRGAAWRSGGGGGSSCRAAEGRLGLLAAGAGCAACGLGAAGTAGGAVGVPLGRRRMLLPAPGCWSPARCAAAACCSPRGGLRSGLPTPN